MRDAVSPKNGAVGSDNPDVADATAEKAIRESGRKPLFESLFMRLAPIPVAAPHTPEWYAARSTGIGASEMAAAAGISDWSQPLAVFQRKRRLIEGQPDDFEETEAIEAGRFLEHGIKPWYTHRTGNTLIDPSPLMHRHAKHPFVFATPDGIVTPAKLLEVKNTGEFMKAHWGEEQTDYVPQDYLVQCYTQMEVMGADSCDLAVVIGGNKLRIYPIERNDELMQLVLSAAEELWQRIENNDPPEPDWHHQSTPRLIKAMNSVARDIRVPLSEEAAEAWALQAALGKQETEIKKQRELLKSRVKHEITSAEAYAGILPTGMMIRRSLITKKPQEATEYWDFRAVKFDGGPILELETTEGAI